MTSWSSNPFPSGDADRHEIWIMLVERDIAAFLDNDWDRIHDDFAEDRFVGQSGSSSNPDHWRITFPSLQTYREEWTRQAVAFATVQLKDIDKAEFLFRATVLRDIEIHGDRALAHKKFDGHAKTAGENDLVLNWQTMYWLQRISGKWKLTGFLGYLPNPMPQSTPGSQASRIYLPSAASQHETAGPYSPALKVIPTGLIAISGQGPIDMKGNITGKTIQEQTVLVLENCKRQLEAAGATFADVFKVMVYLDDMTEWNAFNKVYRQYFRPPYPVRTAIQAVLWGRIKVEVDMLAIAR